MVHYRRLSGELTSGQQREFAVRHFGLGSVLGIAVCLEAPTLPMEKRGT